MVAASIVTYNTPIDEIQRCLDTLTTSPQVKRVDIIDNSRNAAIESMVTAYPSHIVNYILNDNTGYGAGNNISMRRSLEDSEISYHLVMNSDILFDNELIGNLIAQMDADTTIGLTIPMVTDREGHEQSSYHPLPTPLTLICHRFVPRIFWNRKMREYEIMVAGRKEPLEVPYVHGCFMMMRTDALREVGIFDERFFMYPEDIDLTRRIHEKYRALVIPWLSIVHDHRAESRRSFRMLCIHATNMIRYFNKWGWR